MFAYCYSRKSPLSFQTESINPLCLHKTKTPFPNNSKLELHQKHRLSMVSTSYRGVCLNVNSPLCENLHPEVR